MKVVTLVPARMASTRFPGKPLARIAGIPMIEHIRRRLLLNPALGQVVVATCDREIMEAVETAGGKAVMTSATHVRCCERIAEAAGRIDADIVINVQGDEPLVNPEMVARLLPPLLAGEDFACTNLMSSIRTDEDFQSRNVVKTVVDSRGRALYFSREPIPSVRMGSADHPRYKQLGLMAFRKEGLARYAALSPTPLEIAESVDLLRLVEHGLPVKMILDDSFPGIGVDTPADLERAEALMRDDPLFGNY
jgi:3-deoxy-manno-octulosonate cytidylyltransferase (CMP-KDO synthetase)